VLVLLVAGCSRPKTAAPEVAVDAAPAVAAAPPPPAAPAEDLRALEKAALAILETNCQKCHGPNKARGGLRLTSREQLAEGGDSGPAITPDKPDESRILQAVRHENGLKMPPRGKLPPEQVEILAHWVRAGAPWDPGTSGAKVRAEAPPKKGPPWRWAGPPAAPPVPAVKNHAWVKGPIDAFILRRLEDKGLTPAAPAGRAALLRRVTYDLTGLPPTPEETDAFLADASADAYERVVDRLLASPHYGEKWGRHWLDLVRYADTNGFEGNNLKPFGWRFRDWVIDSFNKDKPYDHFLREQLAGDELDEPTAQSLIATGYYRLGPWDRTPPDEVRARYDVLDGIVSTTSQVVLGMSVGCARCHDHKKDPIPQADYYRLLAFFRDVTDMAPRNTRKLAEAAERARYEEQMAQRVRAEQQLRYDLHQLEQRFAEALQRNTKETGLRLIHTDITDLHYRSYRGSWKELPEFTDLEVVEEGRVPHDLFTLEVAPGPEPFGLVFEGTLTIYYEGRYIFYVDSSDGVRLTVGGKLVLDSPGPGHKAAEAEVVLPGGGLPIRLELFVSPKNPDPPHLQLSWSGLGVDRRSLCAAGAAPGTRVELLQAMRQHGLEVLGSPAVEEYVRLNEALARLTATSIPEPGLEVMCVAEKGRADTHILLRGNPATPGKKVTAGFPEVFGGGDALIPQQPQATSSGKRRVLAEWLARADNPLTARVMVNRIWQHHFGRGIVSTPNEFGNLGEPPSHPELLDWLASEFVRGGWQLKPLHRHIVLSAAYRTSSAANRAGLAADPEDVLLWRFPPRRLTAEEIRDSVLAASSKLNRQMGGPGVFPPIAQEVLDSLNHPGGNWEESPPDQAARRSVYVFVDRNLLLPVLAGHDWADPDSSCPARYKTTVPTQALMMLNDAFTQEQSGALAARLRRDCPGDLAAQIRRALYLTTSRPPDEAAVRRDVAFVQDLQTRQKIDAKEALKRYCLLLLNTNEFIYLD
jgi:mono/diheme cytochrome c family protein